MTEIERQILINQYKILAQQEEGDYYNSQEDYRLKIEILSQGYEYLYSEVLVNDDEIVSAESSQFVIDVLNLYRKLDNSYSRLPKEEQTEQLYEDIAFSGFDGNEETDKYVFAKFFIDDYQRFGELKENKAIEFNSHSNRINRYQKQLDIANNIKNKAFTLDEIKLILDLK